MQWHWQPQQLPVPVLCSSEGAAPPKSTTTTSCLQGTTAEWSRLGALHGSHEGKLSLPMKIKRFFTCHSFTTAHRSPHTWLGFCCKHNGIYLVCLLPLRSCCATEAHLSASCVTKRRCRSRSLSGNFFTSDSSIRALKLMRPFGEDTTSAQASLRDGLQTLRWNSVTQ